MWHLSWPPSFRIRGRIQSNLGWGSTGGGGCYGVLFLPFFYLKKKKTVLVVVGGVLRVYDEFQRNTSSLLPEWESRVASFCT